MVGPAPGARPGRPGGARQDPLARQAGRRAPGALVLCATFLAAAPAEACRLALVLALDVSSSVDAREDRLQREGLARALTAPRVLAALTSGEPVAVHVFEWSGRDAQAEVVPGWTLVADEADALALARAIAASPRRAEAGPTAVGEALAVAAARLAEAPGCRARTVDVAGDGTSNEGMAPRAAPGLDGVTVNALVVGDPSLPSREEGARLVAWFQAEVLRGPGAFSLVAEGYDDYARAMEEKLLRELEPPALAGLSGG